MKSTPLPRFAAALAIGAALAAFNVAKADPVLDFSSTVGSAVSFDGHSNFTFAPSSDNFSITLDHTGNVSPNWAQGLLGEITGTYTIGSIDVSGDSAGVTGAGDLVIHDGLGKDFSGNLSWLQIGQQGTGDTLNVWGKVNLTGITYGGTNASLLEMASTGSGKTTLTFQFTSPTNINDLKTHTYNKSFSGSIQEVPDGGTTVILLGLALSGLAFVRRRRLA